MLVYEPYRRPRRHLRVPPIPATYALTDRATGAVWYLKINSAGNAIQLCTSSQLSPLDTKTTVIYPADNEPMITSTQRIYASNGSLSIETVKPNNVNSQPLLLRQINNDLKWWLVGITNGSITITSEPSS